MSFRLSQLTGWIRAAGLRCDATGDAADLEFTAMVLDSRRVAPGAMFAAVSGENTHGARFAPAAIEAGATALLVEGVGAFDLAVGVPVIVVDDARAALEAAARGWLADHPIRVVGVTGSNGKTTTKDMVAIALNGTMRVGASPGNLNSRWGLPLAVLSMRGDEEVLVLEMGASAPDEIGRLASIARPEVGVITNVGPAHLEFFGSVDAVVRTKSQLVAALPATGVAVLPRDDDYFDAMCHAATAPVRSFGSDAQATVRVESVALGLDGLSVRIAGAEATLPLFGEVNALNAAAAVATAAHFGVGAPTALGRLESLQTSEHRSRRIQIGARVILDDCYNANPASMRAALSSLAAIATSGRRIAILADMAELGPSAPALHRAVLEHAAVVGLDAVLLAGSHFSEAAAGAKIEVLWSGPRVEAAAMTDALGDGDGDLVLLKGSRSEALERVLDELERRASGVDPLHGSGEAR